MTDEQFAVLDERLESIQRMLMVIANNTQRPGSTQTYYFPISETVLSAEHNTQERG